MSAPDRPAHAHTVASLPLTIGAGLRTAVRRHPDKVALSLGPRELRYGALGERINRVANAAGAMGLAPGAHVVLIAPNCIEYLELVAGLADAGLAAVTANPHLTMPELAAICDDAQAQAIICHDSLEEQVRAINAVPAERIVTIGRDYEAWRDRGSSDPAGPVIDEHATFAISYTSGTTGRPKGVLLSHRSRVLTFFAMAVEYGCYGPDDLTLALAPMYHGAGFAFACAPLYFGGTTRILAKFDPERTLHELQDSAATSVFMVPTHFHALFALPEAVRAAHRYPALKTIISNAAPLAQPMKERIVDYFGEGLLFEAYGSTEGGIVSNLRPVDQLRKLQCVGLPFPCTEIRILGEDGAPVAPGTPGEVWSRSAYLFNGYWRQPEATAEATRDGWLSVGDLGRLDSEGYLYIEGRKKDMIISGGINVYPREIEELLQTHPAVHEAAVVGIADPQWGEAVVACIVRRPDASVDGAELERLCRERLAKFKVPKSFRFVDEIPRNPSGKVVKRMLREGLENQTGG
ncbi:MAG: AMP-binding protein [Gammaproteobacteria bacterium]|nr:AMP-binding protein [Gammaproteobacteria bacterium]